MVVQGDALVVLVVERTVLDNFAILILAIGQQGSVVAISDVDGLGVFGECHTASGVQLLMIVQTAEFGEREVQLTAVLLVSEHLAHLHIQ